MLEIVLQEWRKTDEKEEGFRVGVQDFKRNAFALSCGCRGKGRKRLKKNDASGTPR